MIKNCPMRHENGNCLPAGGFCTANKNICEALLNAYGMGKAQLSQEGTTKDATTDTISRQFEEIVVRYLPDDLCNYPEYKGKPYFSIHYKENGKDHIGYGTYKPEVLSQYLRDYFISSAQLEPKWIPCDETVDIPDHEVMACDRYGEFIIGYLDCKDEQWLCESDSSLMYDPVAWCELPEPYKEGGADG